MDNEFNEEVFREFGFDDKKNLGHLIKADNAKIMGSVKISVDEESFDGVKVVLQKDQNDNIKEIKFVCSCGQTKSILLDYSDQ